MKPNAKNHGVKWLFTVTVIVALFTGFGNMPLYGRYYIADIPGFHWSGNFIVNLKIHLVAGAVLLAVAIYHLTGAIIRRDTRSPQTSLDRALVLATALVLISGILVGLKNFAFMTPGLALNMTLTFLHLGAAMLVAVVGLIYFIVKRNRQIQSSPEGN